MKKIRFIVLISVCLLLCFACKTKSVQQVQNQQAVEKEQKRKAAYKEYKKTYKQHLKNQDPATRKRIKAHLREQKKAYRKNGMGGRFKQTCVPD
ncbi:MAG: hypothetical protein J5606_07860 [Bacteroidales bacterium]|nr:hypothetical protein [Bacteroidales bacterium]